MSKYFVGKKLAIFIFVILAVFIRTNNIYADFGTGCPGVGTPVGSELQYLQNNTIYGVIQQSLDVTQYIPLDANGTSTNCNNNLPNIKVCIKNPALNPPCEMATFTAGGSAVALSAVSHNPSLGSHPQLSTLTLKAAYIGSPSCNQKRSTDNQNSWTCTQFLCLTMPTPYGNEPLVCKQITTITNSAPAATNTQATCKLVADSCSKSQSSQSLFSFSGPAVECLTDTLRFVFFDPQPNCVGGTDINLSFLASFSSFQESLKVSVRALLILYTMGYGITLLMNPDKLDAEGVVMFVLKMMLVGYFSVGWGPAYFTSGGIRQTHNGMIEWGLPILTQLTTDLASMAFSAGNGGRGVCEFDNSHYPRGKGYFGLWDRVDCKLGAYLMVKKIYGFGFLSASSFTNGYSKVGGSAAPNTHSIALGFSSYHPLDNVNTGNAAVDQGARVIDEMVGAADKVKQIGMAVIMFLLLLGGNIIIVIGLMYFLCIIISLILGFVSLYTVCLVTLHVLIYISPIFVPMALFQRTKTYFDSWLKITLSCALQPMVVAGFLAFVMNMYDDVFFGGCQFKRHDYSNGTRFFSTFEPRLPQGDYSSCITTPGFMIINYVLGYGWNDYGAIFFTVDYAKDELNLLANTCLLIIFSYIMGFFLDVVYSMAADLTGGLNVASVALNMKNMARAMQKKLNETKDKIKDKLKSAGKGGPKPVQGGKGAGPNGGGGGASRGAPAPTMGGKDGGGGGGGGGGGDSQKTPPAPTMGA